MRYSHHDAAAEFGFEGCTLLKLAQPSQADELENAAEEADDFEGNG
jgi:hypothetical protein